MKLVRIGTLLILLTPFVSSALFAQEPVSAIPSIEEIESVLDTKLAQLDSYTAKVTMSLDVQSGFIHLEQDSQGAIEYLRIDGKPHHRMEMDGVVKTNIPGTRKGIPHKVLSVFDGEYNYQQTEMLGKTRVGKRKPRTDRSDAYASGKEFIEKLREKGQIRALPSTVVNGYPVYVLEAQVDPAMQQKLEAKVDMTRFYIAKDSGINIKLEAFGPGATPIMTMTYSDIKVNPKLDPSRFSYTPPPGVQVEDMSGAGLDKGGWF